MIRLFVFIITIILLSSCSQDYDKLVKIRFYNSINVKEFSFVFNADFLEKDKSLQDKEHPKLTKMQSKIVQELLKKNNYCINNSQKLIFTITSKQTELYDVTVADFDKIKYRSRPLSPVTYFGKCL